VQNSVAVSNTAPPAAPVQKSEANTSSNQLVAAMSPFDRQVVNSLHQYAEWGYFLLLALVLLMLLLFEVRRRWRRGRQRRNRRQSLLDSDE
jgi:predicted PurR-regulated permease PerM